MGNKYYWEYYRHRKDGKMNMLVSRPLRLSEVQDYIKNDWLQANLTFQKNGVGTVYNIGHITLNKTFLTYNHETENFIEIPLHRLERWLHLSENLINNRIVYLH